MHTQNRYIHHHPLNSGVQQVSYLFEPRVFGNHGHTTISPDRAESGEEGCDFLLLPFKQLGVLRHTLLLLRDIVCDCVLK